MGASSDRNLSKADQSSSAGNQQAEDQLQAVQGQLSATRQELEQVRSQLADYEALLGELPDIFERKYQQRQQPFLLQQQLLSRENQSLRDIVKGAGRQSPPPPPSALKPAAPATAPTPPEPLRPDPPRPSPPRPSPGLIQALPAAMAAKGLAVLLGFVALGAVLGTVRQSLKGQASPPASMARPPASTSQTQPSPTKPTEAKPAPPKPAPSLLVLNSSGPNWVEVRTLSRQRVYEGMLKGEKMLPLGQGLQVLAGRPDLLTVRQGAGRPKVLGRIDELVWISFRPPAAPAAKPATKAPKASP